MNLILAAQEIEGWMVQFARQYGYFGVLAVSFIGALSIVFPIPYTLVIFLSGKFLDPLLVAIAGGLGSALGEISGYILGYYGRAVISEQRQRKIDFILKVFSRYGPIAIFMFALTPLPDDLLFIPLGIMRYKLLKAFIPCVLGKALMCLILAVGGQLSISIIENMIGEGELWMTIIFSVILMAVVVIMLKVDWEKFLTQYIERSEKRSKE